jgi:hypothetical protein
MIRRRELGQTRDRYKIIKGGNPGGRPNRQTRIILRHKARTSSKKSDSGFNTIPNPRAKTERTREKITILNIFVFE